MESFKAGTQYGDWKGTASADAGCPIFRVLCERWDSTTPNPWDFTLHGLSAFRIRVCLQAYRKCRVFNAPSGAAPVHAGFSANFFTRFFSSGARSSFVTAIDAEQG
jgi:hypothetical protein